MSEDSAFTAPYRLNMACCWLLGVLYSPGLEASADPSIGQFNRGRTHSSTCPLVLASPLFSSWPAVRWQRDSKNFVNIDLLQLTFAPFIQKWIFCSRLSTAINPSYSSLSAIFNLIEYLLNKKGRCKLLIIIADSWKKKYFEDYKASLFGDTRQTIIEHIL